jgi:hypothetical protein
MGQQASHIKNDTDRDVKVTLICRSRNNVQKTFTMAPYEELRFGGFYPANDIFFWKIGKSSVLFSTDAQFVYDGYMINEVGWGDLHGPCRNVIL